MSMPWFHHVFGAGPTSSGRGAAAPRLPRLALRVLSRDQQLSQDLKIPTKDPQPHVPTVAAEGLISTPIQTIARLQRANRRLDPRMTPPCLAEFHSSLLLLTLSLNVARLGQARLLYQLHQLALILRRMEAAIKRRASDPTVRVVVAPASSPPPGPRCPPPREAGSRSGTRSPRHPRSPRRGGRTREVEEPCHV